MLSALGVEYEAVSTEVEELREGAAPEVLVLENARRKALAGLELAGAGAGGWSLGVDTEVVLEGRLLGKAASEGEARERLQALSGRTHEVLSGVALVRSDADGREMSSRLTKLDHRGSAAVGRERSGVASSLVTFIDLDDATLDRYLASGEWRDRAGAYAIQGLGSLLIARLEGDFANVVGLPLGLLLDLAPELFPRISSDSLQ
jgi:septum formation protein